MGVSKSVYAGPLLVVPFEMIEENEIGRACKICWKKPSDESAMFCATCGTELSDVSVGTRKVRKVDPWEFSKAIGESLYAPNSADLDTITKYRHREFWFPNKEKGGEPREFYICDVSVTFGKDIDIEKEKTWFAEAFRAEIEEATRRFGQAEVSWVVVSFWQ